MKFLKLTLVAILTIGLLTAVLPSSKLNSPQEPTRNTIKKSKDKFISLINRKKDMKQPTNG